jgi:hypothetical protein
MKYKNFKIEFLDVNKKIDLIAYDKRKFKHDLKSTEAYVFEKGEYK